MNDPHACDLCGRAIPCGSGFLVKIEVYADPQLPPMTSEDIAAANLNGTLAELISQIKTMTAEELLDGVHRSFKYQLCAGCHKLYLSNPLGLPRTVPISSN